MRIFWENTLKHRARSEAVILCMGDSITESDGDTSYPSLLEKELNRRSGKKFSVINLAQAGKGSDDIVKNFQQWIHQYQPEYVVIMMGLFDVGIVARQQSENWITSLRSYKAVASALMKGWGSLFSGKEQPRQNSPAEEKKAPGEDPFKTDLVNLPPDDQRLYMAAVVLQGRGQYEDEEKVYRMLLSKTGLSEPLKDKFYQNLGRNLWTQKKYGDYAEIMEHISYFSWPDDWAETICSDKKMREPVTGFLNRHLENDPQSESDFELLMACYLQTDDQAAEELVRQYGGAKRLSVNITTKRNFKEIFTMAEAGDYALVLVQYPTKDLNLLKSMVRDSPMFDQIIFVDNQKNFEAALARGAYKEYFRDRAGASFGHGTEKGNQLIAESIADAILRNSN